VRSILITLLFSAGCLGQPADLVLRHGKIVTLDKPTPQVQALAARDGRIIALGTDRDIEKQIGKSTQVIDLKGKLAIPGFIESHGHFSGLGASKMMLNLRDAKNWDDIVAMVAAAAREAKPGEWILGRGWHQSKWDKKPEPNLNGFPVNASLNAASPHNPVLLEHASGHAIFVNAEALRVSNVISQTVNPSGGEIQRDAHGQPTGLLNETAQGLVRGPAETVERARQQLDLASRECLSKGVTTFEDAGSPLATVDLMRTMEAEGKLGVRLWVMLRAPNPVLAPNLAKYRTIGDRFTVRAIKRQIDGALGSRGAWLLSPYTDQPDTTGFNTEDPADIRKTAELAIAAGYQLCVHAIGDRANREVLNIYESVFKEHPDQKNLRWRIEHAQHLNAADIPRFAQLGVVAAMQGIHCTSDAPYVLLRLGPQRAEEGAYVWQKLIKSGAIVSNGTDTPVEDVNPIASYYASVSRKLKDGTAFYPDQRMTREEALRSYTWNAAYAAFEENSKGSLALGKLADITVLSQDILTIPEAAIPSTQIEYTIVGGKILYQLNER
jgi:predicted amidohydrolase YtcJ